MKKNRKNRKIRKNRRAAVKVSGEQLQCVYQKNRLGASDARNYATMLTDKFYDSLTNVPVGRLLANVGTESAGGPSGPRSRQRGGWGPFCGRGPLQITGKKNYNFCKKLDSCGCSGIKVAPNRHRAVRWASARRIACGQRFLVTRSRVTPTARSRGWKKTACWINVGKTKEPNSGSQGRSTGKSQSAFDLGANPQESALSQPLHLHVFPIWRPVFS